MTLLVSLSSTQVPGMSKALWKHHRYDPVIVFSPTPESERDGIIQLLRAWDIPFAALFLGGDTAQFLRSIHQWRVSRAVGLHVKGIPSVTAEEFISPFVHGEHPV
jgi:hypothetical protein